MKNINSEQIYNILASNLFDIWYEKDFTDHIVGEKDAPSKREIIQDIENMFTDNAY